MEPKYNFQEEFFKSQQAFIKQFDKNSSTYHNGDPTPVPVGGDRIPESMPTIYQEETRVGEEEEKVSKNMEIESKGSDYELNLKKLEDLIEKRALLGEIKKSLGEVCPPLEAILRIKGKKLAKEKEDKQIECELIKLKGYIEIITSQNEELMKTEYREKYCEGINQVCKEAFKQFKDKEDYTNYAFLVKRYTSMLFQDMGRLLEEIKKVKKLI